MIAALAAASALPASTAPAQAKHTKRAKQTKRKKASRRYVDRVRLNRGARYAGGPLARKPKPQATATPTPAPSSGSVLWKADASAPLAQEWASLNTPGFCNGSVTKSGLGTAPYIVQRPDGPGGRGAYHFMSDSTAVCPGDSVRSELGQGNPTKSGSPSRLFNEGLDAWISFQVYLPDDLSITPRTTDGSEPWQLIAQWKQLGSLGTPTLAMHVEKGKIGLFQSDTNDGASRVATPMTDANGVDSEVPAVRNRWLRFTLHVVFSPSAAKGLVEWYGDLDGNGVRRLWPTSPAPHRTYTMKVGADGETVPSHARIGIYRNKLIAGVSHLAIAGYTVATNRAAAEATAF
ncbi:MAG TPA: heparin lyase I family protein [Solirubrobacteraceae bacterium]